MHAFVISPMGTLNEYVIANGVRKEPFIQYNILLSEVFLACFFVGVVCYCYGKLCLEKFL